MVDGPDRVPVTWAVKAFMLSLAIILTIVSAALFGMGIGLSCYVIATKIRETRQRSGLGAITTDSAADP